MQKHYKDKLLDGVVGRPKTDDGTMIKTRSPSALIFGLCNIYIFCLFTLSLLLITLPP